jgi:hypothetical protein
MAEERRMRLYYSASADGRTHFSHFFMASSGQSFGFFVRTLRPLIMLALLLSIAINVFLVSHSPFPVHKEEATGSGSVSLALGDEAFGKVDRGFSLQPQTVDAEGKALPPVGSYVVTSGLLQPIPNVLQLYRDQGIRLDTTWLQNLIGSLGAPINMAKNPLLPQQYIFRTVDGQYDVSLFLDSLIAIELQHIGDGLQKARSDNVRTHGRQSLAFCIDSLRLQ